MKPAYLVISCVAFCSLVNGQSGIITTFAGNGTVLSSGDGGLATNASTNTSGVAVDASGNLFIADGYNNRVRKVSTSGIITTIAGNGIQGFSGDGGPATSAELAFPVAVAVDASGTLFIADLYNNRIRKVSTAGIITTVAGNGTRNVQSGLGSYSGDNGPATAAGLNYPYGVAVDAPGNLYIADLYNNRVRKVAASGTITTIAGNGQTGFAGDGGPATSAQLDEPFGIAVDTSGNLFVSDYGNGRVRKISASGTDAESRAVIKPTPVQFMAARSGGQGGGAAGPRGIRLLPPGAQEQLHLSADQQKQLSDLETEAQAKVGKMLTPEQQQQLRQARPQQRPGNEDGNRGPAAGSGGRPRAGGVRLLRPGVEGQLHLTSDQQKQVADLQTEVQAKLDRILTSDQQQQLRQFRPQQRQGSNEGGNPPAANPDDRPARPEGQIEGQGRNQGGGSRREMAENKTPVSPNPGQTVGLFLDTPKAFTGYTLFAPKHNLVTYLMDNQGRVVHQWKSGYEPGQSAYLMPNGHLIRAGMLKVQGGTGGGEGGRIEEYDWEGNLVWGFNHASRDYQLHHDFKAMPNGHILALMVERKSREEAVKAGFNPNLLRDDYLSPDAVVEIEPIRPNGGRIVWEWHVWDHLIHNADPAAHPELIDPNLTRGIPAFWNHVNSLDYNPSLDQIVLSVRGNNEIWIIDHSTTKAEAASHTGGKQGRGGDLIYRWGNAAAYKRGTASDQQLVQQHDAEWIPAGYPGAGHMTIFNNGYDRGWSSVEEIVLPMDSSGHYILGSGKPYGPEKPVWHYEAKSRTDFFSSEISGAQRLPNGNTLICAGVVGHLFEITPSGEMVWQYVNAMVRGGILAQGEVPGKDTRGHLWNAVFKIDRYEPDYPGLTGKSLTPGNVIELPASQKGKTGLDNSSAGPEDRPGRGQGDRKRP